MRSSWSASLALAACVGCGTAPAGPARQMEPKEPKKEELTEELTDAIVNPGFERGWEGWKDDDPSGTGTGISGEAYQGANSVKLSEKPAFVSQTVSVLPKSTYRLSAFVRGGGNLGVKVGGELFFEQQREKKERWAEVSVTFRSGDLSQVIVFCSFAGSEARFDDFRLHLVEGGEAETSARIKTSSAGGYGLSPELPPGKNFDLLGWYLNTPADTDKDGKPDRFSEVELANGATDPRYFYTAKDGGMVFSAPISGVRTSENTKFTRTELREMLRRGDTRIDTKNDDATPNKNNWVLSSAPPEARSAAGGGDGTLRATLAVNHVTTTGDAGQVGRVIVGQIHASEDEPVRIYYRKLPGNSRGSIYIAHEPSGRDDFFVDLIGSRSDRAPDPVDGIALNEKFTYQIETRGNTLRVSIKQKGELRAEKSVDMTGSGYDVAKEYLYFKAGVYNQNNTGEATDYVQATFYELEHRHGNAER